MLDCLKIAYSNCSEQVEVQARLFLYEITNAEKRTSKSQLRDLKKIELVNINFQPWLFYIPGR